MSPRSRSPAPREVCVGSWGSIGRLRSSFIRVRRRRRVAATCWSRRSHSFDGARLVFLGDPEPGYGEELAARIRERRVEARVSVLPSVPLDELLAHTAEADVGVTLLQDTCENHRLALPNKLFEYIVAGVPVVASALPETERLVSAYGIGWCAAPTTRWRSPACQPGPVTARRSTAAERLAAAAAELRWSREQTRLTGLYAGLAARRGPRSFRCNRRASTRAPRGGPRAVAPSLRCSAHCRGPRRAGALRLGMREEDPKPLEELTSEPG